MGHITVLIMTDLSNNQMKGTIDNGILNLPNLEIFNLNNNLFEGQIPSTLLSYSSLKTINLTSNLFVGTLPFSFPYPSTLSKSSM